MTDLADLDDTWCGPTCQLFPLRTSLSSLPLLSLLPMPPCTGTRAARQWGRAPTAAQQLGRACSAVAARGLLSSHPQPLPFSACLCFSVMTRMSEEMAVGFTSNGSGGWVAAANRRESGGYGAGEGPLPSPRFTSPQREGGNSCRRAANAGVPIPRFHPNRAEGGSSTRSSSPPPGECSSYTTLAPPGECSAPGPPRLAMARSPSPSI